MPTKGIAKTETTQISRKAVENSPPTGLIYRNAQSLRIDSLKLPLVQRCLNRASPPMRIDLSNPDAVWQAANPILTQHNAVAIFAKALSLLPPGDHRGATLHRICLAMCDDKALFSAGRISASLTVLSVALQRGSKISCLRRLIRGGKSACCQSKNRCHPRW